MAATFQTTNPRHAAAWELRVKLGLNNGGGTANDWQPSVTAADPDATPAALVLALNGLDSDLMRSVSRFSHAEAARMAERRAESPNPLIRAEYIRREREAGWALEAMLADLSSAGAHGLRVLILRRLAAVGVTFGDDVENPVLNCASHLACLIRTGREYVRAIGRGRSRGRDPRELADLEDYLTGVRAELAAAGIPGL